MVISHACNVKRTTSSDKITVEFCYGTSEIIPFASVREIRGNIAILMYCANYLDVIFLHYYNVLRRLRYIFRKALQNVVLGTKRLHYSNAHLYLSNGNGIRPCNGSLLCVSNYDEKMDTWCKISTASVFGRTTNYSGRYMCARYTCQTFTIIFYQ